MNRREFLGGASAFALGGCRCCCGDDGRAYSVSVLGDLHYDTSPDTVYHGRFNELFRGKGIHLTWFKEFVRNAKMWAPDGPSRRILAASARRVTPDTRMVLQTGDLIQGDCNDFALHRRMLADVVGQLKAVYPADLPFVFTAGNHDVREGGKGHDRAAAEPFAAFSNDHHRRELGARACSSVDRTTFAFRQGPDLYVVMDFNFAKEQASYVKAILDANPDVRYTFLVTHGGVFPYDSWTCRWFYLGGERAYGKDGFLVFDPEADAVRREMRAVFARRNAIVLCGHTHHLELKEAQFPEGTITEMTMNSVTGQAAGPDFPGEPEVVREGVSRYGDADWVKAKPSNVALFDEYRPYMTRYWFANAVGHAKLRVSDAGVWFDFYGRDAFEPTKTFRLR